MSTDTTTGSIIGDSQHVRDAAYEDVMLAQRDNGDLIACDRYMQAVFLLGLNQIMQETAAASQFGWADSTDMGRNGLV